MTTTEKALTLIGEAFCKLLLINGIFINFEPNLKL